MRSIILLTFTFLITSINFSFSQRNVTNGRYKGGDIELGKFLAQNLKYPVLSQEYRSVGYSITGVTIAPDGEIIEITCINPIDQFIDNNIKEVIEKSKDNWLKSDSISANQTFYIQIAYTFGSTKDTPSVINPVKSNYNFIEPVVLTALLGKKDKFPASDEYIATKCNESINSGLYSEALKYIDELIKRNPFNKELYQWRISINKELKQNDLILKDAKKLSDFIPGVSLDELVQ